MSANNNEMITIVMLLHKPKEFRLIFQLASFSLNNFDLKKSFHELTRRIHPDKTGTNQMLR